MKNKKHKSHKTIWILVIILLLLFIGTIVFENNKKSTTSQPVPTSTAEAYNFGMHQFVADGTTLDPQEITNYTVSPDGTRAAAVLVQNFGGSGTFYYLAGAMNENGTTTYSDPESLGDRIIINSVNVTDPNSEDNGMIIVEYLDRTPTQSMADAPSVKTTVTYEFQADGNLKLVSN